AGLVAGTQVSVTFSNVQGFLVQDVPFRKDANGAIVVAIPVYVDPATARITSGAVDIVVSQRLASGLSFSRPQTLTIEDLPSVDPSIGLGRVSRAVLAFSMLLAQNHITHLQLMQTATRQAVDTSAAQQSLGAMILMQVRMRAVCDEFFADPS